MNEETLEREIEGGRTELEKEKMNERLETGPWIGEMDEGSQ